MIVFFLADMCRNRYLMSAVEELRLFAVYEQVTSRVAALPDDFPALLQQVKPISITHTIFSRTEK